MITIKSKKEIQYMKEACKVVAILYDEIEKKIKPGMTTWELDQIAERIMIENGAIPADESKVRLMVLPMVQGKAVLKIVA